jgi:Protein of unknown function (DUF1573)
MKKLLVFLAFLGTAQFGQAQVATTAPAPAPELLSIASVHDFGTIPQGRPVTFDFILKNTGKEAIKIENVAASCGCTTPKWSAEPVLPAQQSTITVGYNAAGEGIFEKSVTIIYNGSQAKTIYIKGTVAKALPSAPANNAVSLLKQIN